MHRIELHRRFFLCEYSLTRAGLPMKLNGSGAYQAAVHCATISAAKRIRMWQQQQRRAPSSGLSSPAASSQIETPATPPRRNPGGVTHCLWDDYTLG